MEAIRKERVKIIGRQITIVLPADFKAEEVDVIVLPSKVENEDSEISIDLIEWRKKLKEEFSRFNVDLSNLKYSRDELYERH